MSCKIVPYEGKRPFAFVSYAHDDDQVVWDTIGILQEEYNYRIWFDTGIHSGEDWSQRIFQQIEKCSAFVIFLSSKSLASRNVCSEIAIAFNIPKIKIIPIWITPPCPIPGNMIYFLSATQHAFEKNPGVHTPKELSEELNIAIPDSLRDATFVENGVLLSTEEDIHDLILDETVKEVADNACKERLKLTYIHFSPTVEYIGNESFRGCTALTELVIPKTVRRIGDSAFRDCVSLTKLHLEKEVEIGERAFENCRSLTEIILPNDLSEIYNGVFNSCKSLKTITLPKSLIAIGDNAFASCDHLTEIELPENVSRIDDAVFSGCTSMQKVKFSGSIGKIGKNVFKDCVNLKSISLPSSLIKIDVGCFRGCMALESINVDAKNKHYKSMNGIMFNKNKSILICYPPNISSDVYEVPDSVCKIEDWAFSGANNLREVIIPDSVESIGEGAFFHCLGLEKIVIPYSVDSIHDTAFRGCKELKEVYIESTSVKDWGWGIFYGCSRDLIVYYSSDLVKEYCERLNIRHKKIPASRAKK